MTGIRNFDNLLVDTNITIRDVLELSGEILTSNCYSDPSSGTSTS